MALHQANTTLQQQLQPPTTIYQCNNDHFIALSNCHYLIFSIVKFNLQTFSNKHSYHNHSTIQVASIASPQYDIDNYFVILKRLFQMLTMFFRALVFVDNEKVLEAKMQILFQDGDLIITKYR